MEHEKIFNGYSLSLVKQMTEELQDLTQNETRISQRSIFLAKHLSNCLSARSEDLIYQNIPSFTKERFSTLISQVENNILSL